jgi:hypothetical protein
MQSLGDELVPGAKPAASTIVSEDHYSLGALRDRQVAFKKVSCLIGHYLDCLLLYVDMLCLDDYRNLPYSFIFVPWQIPAR